MLSMRNGVYLNPSYLSGALEPVQASLMFAALGGNNVTVAHPGTVMPTVNQSSGAHHLFDPLNSPPQNQPPSLILASVPSTAISEPPFHLESSQSHLRQFQLPGSFEMVFHGEIMPKHHLASHQESLPAKRKPRTKYGISKSSNSSFSNKYTYCLFGIIFSVFKGKTLKIGQIVQGKGHFTNEAHVAIIYIMSTGHRVSE